MKVTESAGTTTTLATMASIPWCCILPAGLSLASLSGAITARVWLTGLAVPLFPLSVALLGRALWLVHVKRQGRPLTRWATWAATFLAITLWVPRLWAWLS